MVLKVAINGYGTIGKRVADAVTLQDDMEIVGVTKRTPTFEARMAVRNGYPFYAAAGEFVKGFEGEIPGAKPAECGNWHDSDLNMAKWWARRYVDETLANIDERHMTYPQ